MAASVSISDETAENLMMLLFGRKGADYGRMNIIVLERRHHRHQHRLASARAAIKSPWWTARHPAPGETNFIANGGQISVSYCGALGNRQAPWEGAQMDVRQRQAPLLLLQPQADSLRNGAVPAVPGPSAATVPLCAQCVKQIVALGAYYQSCGAPGTWSRRPVSSSAAGRGVAHFYPANPQGVCQGRRRR